MFAKLRDFSARFFALFRRRLLDDRIEDELSFHLEMQIEENRKNGMSAEDARNAALRSLGGVDQAKESHRDARSLRYIDDFFQDLRFGMRMLRRKPGQAFISIFILALAIGPNTAFFSVMKRVMYNSTPYPEPDRLVQINSTHELAQTPFGVSYPDYLDYVKSSRSFEEIAIFENAKVDLTNAGEPERVRAIRASSSLFKVLRSAPLYGSGSLPAGQPVVLLSHGLWMRKFSGERGVLGKAISINSVRHIIAGVMPANYVFTESRYDLLLPLEVDAAKAKRERRDYYPIARLKPGVSIEQARIELSGIASRLAREQVFTNYGVGSTVQELGRNYLPKDIKIIMLSIFLSALFVLLIACTNVSTLLLARATGRGKEIAVRASIGGSRTRLLRQMLTESLLTAAFGGFLGIGLAYAWLKMILALAPSDLPNIDSMSVDRAALVYTAALVLLSSFIFGIIPALRSTRCESMEALKGDSRATAGHSRHRFLNSSLVMETAMAAMLLIFSGLMVRTYFNHISVKPGFDCGHLITAHLELPDSRYGRPVQINALVENVLSKLRNVGGIKKAAAAQRMPMTDGFWGSQFSVHGQPYISPNSLPSAAIMFVTPDYFRALGIQLLKGRKFSDADSHGPIVAIVSETLAKRYLADSPNPIGRRIKFGDANSNKLIWTEIVGVVGDVREWTAEERSQPSIYLLHSRYPQKSLAFVARTDSDPLKYAAAMRSIIRSADPDQTISEIRSMDQIANERVSTFRVISQTVGLLSGFGLALAAFGIFSMVSYMVGERISEIGIRMAFGAKRGDICRMILQRGLALIASGLVLGLAAALATMPFLNNFLFGVTPRDFVSYSGSALIIIASGAFAMFIPVRRAISVDPMISIRHE